MAFKPLDPAIVRRLIESEEDVITPALKTEAALLEEVLCPVCGSKGADMVVTPAEIEVNEHGGFEIKRSPFSKTSPILQGQARCRECQALFAPLSRVIVEQREPVLTAVSPADLRRGPRRK